MTATAHALIGASLAATIANPYLGIPSALLSHFLADIVPHWDAGTNHKTKSRFRLVIEAAADVILGFVLVFILFRNLVDPTYLYAMVVVSQLPDWLEAPSSMLGIKIVPFTTVHAIQHRLQSRMQLPWGLVTQVIVVGIIVALALTY